MTPSGLCDLSKDAITLLFLVHAGAQWTKRLELRIATTQDVLIHFTDGLCMLSRVSLSAQKKGHFKTRNTQHKLDLTEMAGSSTSLATLHAHRTLQKDKLMTWNRYLFVWTLPNSKAHNMLGTSLGCEAMFRRSSLRLLPQFERLGNKDYNRAHQGPTFRG